MDRLRNGQITRVPKLKESHVCRDSWTRLNVLPSKVMQVSYTSILFVHVLMYMYLQQDEVMSELLEHANMDPPPEDGREALATESYLRALNNMFERTLLGKKTRIFQSDGTGMQRLEKGFSYFQQWADELVESGEFESGVDSRKFIAWQVHIQDFTCVPTPPLPQCSKRYEVWSIIVARLYGNHDIQPASNMGNM